MHRYGFYSSSSSLSSDGSSDVNPDDQEVVGFNEASAHSDQRLGGYRTEHRTYRDDFNTHDSRYGQIRLQDNDCQIDDLDKDTDLVTNVRKVVDVTLEDILILGTQADSIMSWIGQTVEYEKEIKETGPSHPQYYRVRYKTMEDIERDMKAYSLWLKYKLNSEIQDLEVSVQQLVDAEEEVVKNLEPISEDLELQRETPIVTTDIPEPKMRNSDLTLECECEDSCLSILFGGLRPSVRDKAIEFEPNAGREESQCYNSIRNKRPRSKRIRVIDFNRIKMFDSLGISSSGIVVESTNTIHHPTSVEIAVERSHQVHNLARDLFIEGGSLNQGLNTCCTNDNSHYTETAGRTRLVIVCEYGLSRRLLAQFSGYAVHTRSLTSNNIPEDTLKRFVRHAPWITLTHQLEPLSWTDPDIVVYNTVVVPRGPTLATRLNVSGPHAKNFVADEFKEHDLAMQIKKRVTLISVQSASIQSLVHTRLLSLS